MEGAAARAHCRMVLGRAWQNPLAGASGKASAPPGYAPGGA